MEPEDYLAGTSEEIPLPLGISGGAGEERDLGHLALTSCGIAPTV